MLLDIYAFEEFKMVAQAVGKTIISELTSTVSSTYPSPFTLNLVWMLIEITNNVYTFNV